VIEDASFVLSDADSAAILVLPVAANDGRTLAMLADARDLMLALAERHERDAHRQYPGELLLTAADRDEKYAVMDTRAQLTRGLKAEGLIA
jgi:hypothetical protein